MATKTFSVRFKEETLDTIRGLADKHKRTVNAEIEYIVERGLQLVLKEDELIEKLHNETMEDYSNTKDQQVINQQEDVG